MRRPSPVVLVTGCSRSSGRAAAAALAGAGRPVYATARPPETSALAAIEEEHGAVGVLVNNAGFSQSGAVATVPVARARTQLETKLFGPARARYPVAPSARLLQGLRRALLDRGGDAFLARQFVRPGAGRG